MNEPNSSITQEEPDETIYPSSDGQPMGETGIHVRSIFHLLHALTDYFSERPDVYIAADMFWYWEKGNREACTAPDVMVIEGVGNHERRSFFKWKENGAVPAAVFEFASEHTWSEDLHEKFDKYQEQRVREYFLFDPEAEYLDPPLQGYRLHGRQYEQLPLTQNSLESELGFLLRAEGRIVRLIDKKTGRRYLAGDELTKEISELKTENLEVKLENLEVKLENLEVKSENLELKRELERMRRLLGEMGRSEGGR